MPNPIFDMMSRRQPYQQSPMNNFSNMLSRFNQFKQTFQGDPKQQVQALLNSGAMTQEQFEQLSGMAKQFQGMMGGGKR